MDTNTQIDNFHIFQVQSNLLVLHLQLAEEKPKRSGDFESSYKNESGKEITVKRSPDGKFASKGGGSTSSDSISKNPSQDEDASNGSIVQIAKTVLSGKLGEQLKDSIINGIKDANIKAGIQKAKISEILGDTDNPINGASGYISKKMDQAVKATGKQPLGVILGEIFVGGYVLATLGIATALAAGATVPVATGVAMAATIVTTLAGNAAVQERVKNTNKEKLEKRQKLVDEVLMTEAGQILMKQQEASRKMFADITTVVEARREQARPAPKIDPQANKTAVAEIAGATGATIKKELMTGAAGNPNIAAGIENTKMADIVTGGKDFFSNATKFMGDKMQEAANATSEKSKDMAIGGAIVSAVALACTTGSDVSSAAREVVEAQMDRLLEGRDTGERTKVALEKLTPKSISTSIEKNREILFNKEIQERLVKDVRQAVENAVAKIKSGETMNSLFDTSKNTLDTRIKDLNDRIKAATNNFQKEIQEDKALRQENALRKKMGFQQLGKFGEPKIDNYGRPIT